MKSRVGFGIIVCLLVGLGYLSSGIYTLESGEHAIVLRFGRIVEKVSNPGIHYRLPFPIESTRRVHVSKVQTVSIRSIYERGLECFTGDENLVNIQANISYDIKDAGQYLYSFNDINRLIQSTAQMILSRELARMKVDEVMTSGKSVLRLTSRDQLQKLLDQLGVGIRIITVELTDISPPQQVNSAFKDVSNARVKKQEIIRDAEGYANSTIPESRGIAAKKLLEANAYARELVSRADAETAAFSAILDEYRENPEILKKQKYYQVLASISEKATIAVHSSPSQNTYYLFGIDSPVEIKPTIKLPSEDQPEIEVIEVD